MDPIDMLRSSRLLIVAGKGGVGKTTVTAVLARAAADTGLRVLVVDVDGKSGIRRLIDPTAAETELGHEPLTLWSAADGSRRRIDGRSIHAGRALADYLADHGMGRLAGRLASGGVLEVVSTAAPGIEDLLVLGKIKQIERSGEYDLIVVDGPAAGHAVSFLMSAAGLADAARVGPIQAQAQDVLAMLSDPARCQVVLVTLAETTPVNELIETAFALEDRVGVALTPIFVNAVDVGDDVDVAADEETDDALVRAAEFRSARRALHRRELDRIRAEVPLGSVVLPWVPVAGLHADDIVTLARALAERNE